MSVLKLPLLGALEQKVGELVVFSITSVLQQFFRIYTLN
jgi:hypothetical protein